MILSESSYVCIRGLKLVTNEYIPEVYDAMIQRACDPNSPKDIRAQVIERLSEIDSNGGLTTLITIAQNTFNDLNSIEAPLPAELTKAPDFETLAAGTRKNIEANFPEHPVFLVSASPRLNLGDILNLFLGNQSPLIVQLAALLPMEKNTVPHISIADNLIALTKSKSAPVRALAFRAIAIKFPPNEVKDFVTKGMKDESPLVRDTVISIILKTLPPGIQSDLSNLMRSESDPAIYNKISLLIDAYANTYLFSTIADCFFVVLVIVIFIFIGLIPMAVKHHIRKKYQKGVNEIEKANYAKAASILEDVMNGKGKFANSAKLHLVRAYLRSNEVSLANNIMDSLDLSTCELEDLYKLACDLDGKQLKVGAVSVYLNILEQDRTYKDVQEKFDKIDTEFGGGNDEAKKSSLSGTTSLKDLAIKLIGSEYTSVSLIGKGGMGSVFKARHKKRGEMVAVKILAPHLADNEALITRFYRETVAIANLAHPNICRIKDIRKAELPFIIMEYIEGTDLKTIISKMTEPFELDEFYRIALQIVDALAFAHSKNIVHRDIKPENLLITTEGVPKIIDFGLVKFKETSSDITATGAMMGTPKYMSPEQLKGETTVAAQTDIFSIGMVLYEMLTLQYPYPQEAVFQRVFMDPSPIRPYNDKVSAQLESIILKCLQRKPEDRIETAQELNHLLKSTRDF
jgi:tRNA A-37 threonylcarbamoyl transferase component Bud32